MNKNDVEWVLKMLNDSSFCNCHERVYLAEQIVKRLSRQWINTEDELPNEDGKVLIQYGESSFGGFSPEIECAYYEDGKCRFWLLDRIVSTNGVTHWMRLPEEVELNE